MARYSSENAFTLIELVVFIVIAAIFIPMAYIAFSAASRGAGKPEAVVTAKFLAEQKLEELTNNPYTTEIYSNAVWPSYDTIAGYDRFHWKWITSRVAYQDSANHATTVIMDEENLPSWQPRKTSPRYKVGDYVRPPISNQHLYRLVDLLDPNISVWENPPGKYYSVGDYVIPTPSTGIRLAYRCIQAGTPGSAEPSWPTGSFQTVTDGTVVWEEHTTSSEGSLAPTWDPTIGAYVRDGGIRWRESTVFKRITVFVTDPDCNQSDRCAYIVNTIVTGRPVGGGWP
jgi:type II secretory pathway pseudopilin PulG